MRLGWFALYTSLPGAFLTHSQNDGEIPDHMNILPLSEAVDHVRCALSCPGSSAN